MEAQLNVHEDICFWWKDENVRQVITLIFTMQNIYYLFIVIITVTTAFLPLSLSPFPSNQTLTPSSSPPFQLL